MVKLNRDAIKYIVIVLMTLNHAAWAFLPRDMVLFYVFSDLGYATCVTMCFFLVEGLKYTGSQAVYRKRMLVFALIAQLPFQLAIAGEVFRFQEFNVLFNLLLCQYLVSVLEAGDGRKPQAERSLKIVGIVFLSLFCDWGPMAPLFTALFWRAGSNAAGEASEAGKSGEAGESAEAGAAGEQGRTRRQNLKAYAGAAAAFFLYEMLFPTDGLEFAFARWTEEGRFGGTFLQLRILSAAFAACGVLISMALVVFGYNGKRAARGRAFNKYFFYVYYPLHLLIIGLIRA